MMNAYQQEHQSLAYLLFLMPLPQPFCQYLRFLHPLLSMQLPFQLLPPQRFLHDHHLLLISLAHLVQLVILQVLRLEVVISVQLQLHQRQAFIRARQLQPWLLQRFKCALHFHQLLGFLLLLFRLLLSLPLLFWLHLEQVFIIFQQHSFCPKLFLLGKVEQQRQLQQQPNSHLLYQVRLQLLFLVQQLLELVLPMIIELKVKLVLIVKLKPMLQLKLVLQFTLIVQQLIILKSKQQQLLEHLILRLQPMLQLLQQQQLIQEQLVKFPLQLILQLVVLLQLLVPMLKLAALV